MLIEKVKQMKPLDRFLYWVRERHKIYLKKKQGLKPPWTDDKALQSVFFTSPYRELDKTTCWFRQNIRGPLCEDSGVVFATVAFRWFNKIETAIELMKPRGMFAKNYGLFESWEEKVALGRLQKLADKQAVFTGAYMVKLGNGPPGCKIPQVCNAITNVWETLQKESPWEEWEQKRSLETAWRYFKEFRGLGPFMAYEIVCDLRYTRWLENVLDASSWTNIGPGASRGLARLNGTEIKLAKGGTKDSNRKPPKDGIQQMVELLDVMRRRLPDMPHFELREVEHSLCEFYKAERAWFNLPGHTKRKYNGTGVK